MAELRKPLLTKPAGVFVQILGLVTLLSGLAMLVRSRENTLAGVMVVLIAIGLFWFGRQT